MAHHDLKEILVCVGFQMIISVCLISVSGSCVLAKGRVTSFVIGLLKTDFILVNVLFFL